MFGVRFCAESLLEEMGTMALPVRAGICTWLPGLGGSPMRDARGLYLISHIHPHASSALAKRFVEVSLVSVVGGGPVRAGLVRDSAPLPNSRSTEG